MVEDVSPVESPNTRDFPRYIEAVKSLDLDLNGMRLAELRRDFMTRLSEAIPVSSVSDHVCLLSHQRRVISLMCSTSMYLHQHILIP